MLNIRFVSLCLCLVTIFKLFTLPMAHTMYTGVLVGITLSSPLFAEKKIMMKINIQKYIM